MNTLLYCLVRSLRVSARADEEERVGARGEYSVVLSCQVTVGVSQG